MTASPELLQELRASRPASPVRLRAAVRELAAAEPERAARVTRFRVPRRRSTLVAVPAAAALALATAGIVGIVGLAHPGGERTAVPKATDGTAPERSPVPAGRSGAQAAPGTQTFGPTVGSGGVVPSPNRAQRVTSTLTVEVADSDGVSRASQEALDLTRSLGGHVVNAAVETGDAGRASLTVRVPVARVQEAIAGLSALGKITSQQVTIDDLQESLDTLTQRAASVRAQIVRITARLDSETLGAETRAALETRRRRLRSELRELRRTIGSTNAVARFATVQLTVVTPGSLGVVPVPSRLHRTLDGALNALVWEGVIALAVLVVVAPLLLLVLAAMLGHRLYRRRETERLLAT